MLQSEYGWTHEYILWHVTPAQLLVWAECIKRRRGARRLEELTQSYLIAGAAQGHKPSFRELKNLAKRLEREMGVERHTDPFEIAAKLGLTLERPVEQEDK